MKHKRIVIGMRFSYFLAMLFFITPAFASVGQNNPLLGCLNQVKKIKYPAAKPNAARLEVSYKYDAVGNLIKSVDTAGHETEYFYDAGGREVRTNDPENNAIRTICDVHDNVTVRLEIRAAVLRFVPL